MNVSSSHSKHTNCQPRAFSRLLRGHALHSYPYADVSRLLPAVSLLLSVSDTTLQKNKTFAYSFAIRELRHADVKTKLLRLNYTTALIRTKIFNPS